VSVDNIWFGMFVYFSPHNTCHKYKFGGCKLNYSSLFSFYFILFFCFSIVFSPFSRVRFYRCNRYWLNCTTCTFAHFEKLFRARNTRPYLMGLQDNRGFCEIKYLHCALYYTWQFSFVKINCYCNFRNGI